MSDVILYDKGLHMVAEKNYGEALIYFNRIIRQFPMSPTARMAMFQKGSLRG